MDNLKIDCTIKTPEIDFDSDKGELKIIGRAIPENPEEFFTDATHWIEEYFKAPKEQTTIDVQLEYINSGSSKFILELFHSLQEKHKAGKKCKINWYYEEDDEAVLELGRHYQSILELPFRLIEIM